MGCSFSASVLQTHTPTVWHVHRPAPSRASGARPRSGSLVVSSFAALRSTAAKYGLLAAFNDDINDTSEGSAAAAAGTVGGNDGDVFGDDVNIASRVENFAPEGGIAISDKISKKLEILYKSHYI